MVVKSDLWKYIVKIWFVANVLLFFFPWLYTKLYPYFSFLVLFMFITIMLLKGFSINKRLFLSVYFLCLFTVVLSIILEKEFKLYLTALSAPMAVFCFDGLKIKKNEQKLLKNFLLIIWLITICISYKYFYKFLDTPDKMLNPNTLALVLLDISMLLIYLINILEKKLKRKILSLAIALGTIAALFGGFQSRGCTMAFGFFCLFGSIHKLIFKRKFQIICITFGVVMLSVIVPFVYMYLANKEALGTPASSEKDLYTRVYVWKDIVDELSGDHKELLLGLPADTQDSIGKAVHNNSLQIISYIGVIGFLVYSLFLLAYMYGIISSCFYDEKSNLLIIAFISLLLLGITEVSMLWAITYSLNYSFLSIASGKANEILYL